VPEERDLLLLPELLASLTINSLKKGKERKEKEERKRETTNGPSIFSRSLFSTEGKEGEGKEGGRRGDLRSESYHQVFVTSSYQYIHSFSYYSFWKKKGKKKAGRKEGGEVRGRAFVRRAVF